MHKKETTLHKGKVTIQEGSPRLSDWAHPKSYGSYRTLRANMKSNYFPLLNNNHKFKSYAKMATREQRKANNTCSAKNAMVSKSPLRRLRPYPLYVTRALAGLLNQWDLAVQIVSRQPLPQSLAAF